MTTEAVGVGDSLDKNTQPGEGPGCGTETGHARSLNEY